MTHDKKCAFHQDGPCNCWMSRVSPCGAETSETTTPEPEWLTSLRQDMRAAIGSTPITSRLDVIASVATGVAAAHLRPIYAELVNARDEYEGTETRRAELEENVRALGGDPDRMVDPRDHEAAVLAMHDEMRAAADNWDRVVLNDACAVAERHMLRMAQTSLGAAPEVREVPAGEAREGDTVTDTRRGRIVRLPGDRNAMVRWDGNSGVQEVDLDWSRITISRPVSPLPDQPGTFGLARVRGHGDIKHRLLLVRRNGALVWSGVDGTYGYGQVTDFEPLPARAGVDEGGKR